MNFFENTNIPEDERLEKAISIVVAIRDLLSISEKREKRPTYTQSLQFIKDIVPEAYGPIYKLLAFTDRNHLLDYYTERGNWDPRKAISIIEEDIARIRKDLDAPEKKKAVKRQLDRLAEAKEYFYETDSTVKFSEHRLLENDYSLERDHYTELFNKTATYRDYRLSNNRVLRLRILHMEKRDYRLSNNRVLRLRILHMEKAEAVTGADLTYEQYDMKKKLVRFVFLQYKASETKSINVYFSQNGLMSQMSKLNSTFCQSGYCLPPNNGTSFSGYRLPHCSAFIRPTRKILTNSRVISSGIHIPVCVAAEVAKSNKKIGRYEVSNCSISHNIFEEMFNSDMLGSRWLPVEEVEAFYKKKKILQPDGAIKLYASEIIR